MATIPERKGAQAVWVEDIYAWTEDDWLDSIALPPTDGSVPTDGTGLDMVPVKQLADRTQKLRYDLDNIPGGGGSGGIFGGVVTIKNKYVFQGFAIYLAPLLGVRWVGVIKGSDLDNLCWIDGKDIWQADDTQLFTIPVNQGITDQTYWVYFRDTGGGVYVIEKSAVNSDESAIPANAMPLAKLVVAAGASTENMLDVTIQDHRSRKNDTFQVYINRPNSLFNPVTPRVIVPLPPGLIIQTVNDYTVDLEVLSATPTEDMVRLEVTNKTGSNFEIRCLTPEVDNISVKYAIYKTE